jgi:hypothetical protein
MATGRGRVCATSQVKRRIAIAVCCVLLSAVGLGGARGGPSGEVVVRGQITDDAGEPVAAHAVRLLKSRTILTLSNLKKRSQNLEETRGVTDSHGFYEFTFPRDSEFRYFYLRFYDPKAFDAVKYRLPEDADISRRARKGRPVHANVVLRFDPDWSEVKTRIERYGAASDRGRILRALGLPSQQVEEAQGLELWAYDAVGVSYLIRGETVVETRRSEPRGDGETAPDGRSEESALAAERIEGADLEER